MMKSFKVMLVPNKRQRTRLFQFAGTARFAYDWALKKEIDAMRFLQKKSGHPKFKSKHAGNFSFYQDTDKIRITATHVKLESIATSKRKNKQRLNNSPVELRGEAIGIDLGIKQSAVCSDGTVFPNINRSKTIQKLKKRLRRLQRSISGKYEMNNRKGKYCKTSNIVKGEQELLKIYHRLSKAVQEQGFYEFRRQIEYKAAWSRIPVLIASTATCKRR